MLKPKIKLTLLLSAICVLLASCTDDEVATPKPMGYFRIDLKEKIYDTARINLPIIFEYPSNVARLDTQRISSNCDFNIVYPHYNATVYCSYRKIDGDFYERSEDNWGFTKGHIDMADYIDEKVYEDSIKNMFGILYTIYGDVASQAQFMLTDSTSHFLRGSLYFNNHPNKDSLAPVAAYITEDLVRIMETAEWK